MHSNKSPISIANEALLKLGETNAERETFDNLANIFAIFAATEALESLYSKDALSKVEYKEYCKKFIAQFRTSLRLAHIDDVQPFVDTYHLNCPVAYHRLVESGVPEVGESSQNTNKLVAETVQYFIGISDAIKLDMIAVDQIHPLLDSLIDRLNQFSSKANWEVKLKVQKWLNTINKMQAHETLTNEQARQMSFDVDFAYDNFYKHLDLN